MALDAYYKAIGELKKGERRRELAENIFSDVGAGALFAGIQAKRAKTAWEGYEAGYKALGYDPENIPERGGFFKQLGQSLIPGGDKGFFQRPEGEVQLGSRMYDRSKISKAGKFLGSDAASFLDDEMREKYLSTAAPGREFTAEEYEGLLSRRPKPAMPDSHLESDVSKQFPMEKPPTPEDIPLTLDLSFPEGTHSQRAGLVGFEEDWETPVGGSLEEWTERQEQLKHPETFLSGLKFDQTGGIGAESDPYGFGRETGGLQGPNFLQDYNMPSIAVGERGRDAAGTTEIQQEQQKRILQEQQKKINELLYYGGGTQEEGLSEEEYGMGEDQYLERLRSPYNFVKPLGQRGQDLQRDLRTQQRFTPYKNPWDVYKDQ